MLEACVHVLEPHGIRVMPLKGIWLQELVYTGAPERAITDVDVLVEDGAYESAQRALSLAGWKRLNGNRVEATFAHPELPLSLDLHARLYTRGAFRMPVTPLFARSSADRELYGVPVALPDPLDVIAHLIGHALKSGNAWHGQGSELRDIARLATVLHIAPRACAERLQELGLARGGRFVLQLMAGDEGFAVSVLRALPADVLGELLTEVALRLRAHMPADSRLSTLLSFVLDRSLLHGARALAWRAVDKLHDAVQRRMGGPPTP